jgi:hypothetical protein
LYKVSGGQGAVSVYTELSNEHIISAAFSYSYIVNLKTYCLSLVQLDSDREICDANDKVQSIADKKLQELCFLAASTWQIER